MKTIYFIVIVVLANAFRASSELPAIILSAAEEEGRLMEILSTRDFSE